MRESQQSRRANDNKRRLVPPCDRVAHLGRIEHPVEKCAIMEPVPNGPPMSADTEEWPKSFAPVTESPPSGGGKTLSRSAAGDKASSEARV